MDEHGNIILNRARPLPDTRRSTYTPPTQSYSAPTYNWWERLNDWVADIGDWIADRIEDITDWVTVAASVITVIALAIWVIMSFVNGGVFDGVLCIIGAFIIGYIVFAIIGLLSTVLGYVLLGIRFIFWNIYSLLAFNLCETISYSPRLEE